MQSLAAGHGATLRDHSPVTGVTDLGAAGIEVSVGGTTVRARSVVVCADAWTNDVLGLLGHRVPLTVTLEQATYFAPPDPESFAPGRLPLWIWMDEPCFYGFPGYGEPTVKAAQDCGGPVVDPETRTSEPDEEMLARLAGHVARILPGAGPPVRSLRCQYTLTPDRDFVLDRVPGHPHVVVGLGAAHGFKFAPTLGRLLADLATGERDEVSATFSLSRPALTDPAHEAHWLV